MNASNETWAPISDDIYVTIFKGDFTRCIIKEQLEAYIYEIMLEMTDKSKLAIVRDYYINAFEWLLANLFRVSGIQLYNDGEVRINISLAEIKDNKKCIFLSQSEISNTKLNVVLYNELQNILTSGIRH